MSGCRHYTAHHLQQGDTLILLKNYHPQLMPRYIHMKCKMLILIYIIFCLNGYTCWEFPLSSWRSNVTNFWNLIISQVNLILYTSICYFTENGATQLSLSSLQICVGKLEDGEAFLKLSSGKKRGLVPADSIEEIWASEHTSPSFHYTSCWDAPIVKLSPSPWHKHRRRLSKQFWLTQTNKHT